MAEPRGPVANQGEVACSSAPLVEAIGEPGGVVDVELVVNCVP